jgi:GLPGLI family protein
LKLLTFITFIVVPLLCCSQIYKVEYAIKLKSEVIERADKDTPEAVLKLYKDAEPVSGILIFNDTISVYSVEDKLALDEKSKFNIAKIRAGGNSVYVNNLSKDLKFYTSEKTGNHFKVNYDDFKFEVTNERKVIKGYNCLKAIVLMKENDYNYIAWFTPDLPFPYGPKNVHGLPGLILMFEDGKGFVYTLEEIDEFDNHVKLPDMKKYKAISLNDYKELFKKTMPKF